jgi:diguanylate cyclase (GGDEF)-like protein
MLWKRKSVDPPPVTHMSVPAPEVDRALDTVAALLRRYGEHAFDVGERAAAEIREEFDAWAARLVRGGDGDAEDGAPKRDFGGARRFFDEHRKSESEYVRTSLSTLRGAIDTFARCVRTSIFDDRSADKAAAGELSALAEALSSNDVARIRVSAAALADAVSGAIEARRKRHRQQLEALSDQIRTIRGELMQTRERATMDGLTRLYNRAAFDEHVARIADLGLLLGTPPSLMMIDLDHFKRLNDQHGHPGGDEALRKVSESLLRNFLRKEDFVARYGGEEFAVVLMDASPSDAKNLAERLRKAVRSIGMEYRGVPVPLTVSVGVSSLVPGETAALWIERADQALYAAKANGRDRVEIADLPAAFI